MSDRIGLHKLVPPMAIAFLLGVSLIFLFDKEPAAPKEVETRLQRFEERLDALQAVTHNLIGKQTPSKQ
jgi:hypothetical protein